MAIDFQDTARQLLMEALSGQGKDGGDAQPQSQSPNGASKGGLSGLRGLAMGAGAAALAPVAAKGIGKLTNVLGVESPTEILKDPSQALESATSNLGDRLSGGIGDMVSGKVEDAGGPGGMLKDAAKSALPFGGGGGGGDKDGTPGVGKGRRMPVQQSMDIGLPIETVYNQFTQFEEWPNFMHRVVRVTQEDECTLSIQAKIWTRTRDFTADIETQRPNERIKWSVSQGLDHTGVVTFHELGPNLTRVLVGFDVKPGGMIEKFARGARHIKRAARADLHRFKAFIETAGEETGAWRGVIEEGELVEEHDPSYDEQREYADASELFGDKDEQDEKSDDGGEEEEESSRGRRGRAQQSGNGGEPRQRSGRARAASGGAQRSRSAGGQRGSSRSGGAQRSKGSSGGSRSSGASRSRSGSSSGGGSSSRGRSSSGGGSSSRGRSSSGGGSSSRSSSRGSSARKSGSSSGTQSRGRSRSSGSGSSGKSQSSSRSRANKS